MRDYIINKDTIAILPRGKSRSLVLEVGKRLEIDISPTLIIKRNCLYNGSTYYGRLKSAELLTGSKYKSPIVVMDRGCCIFFPTNSPRLNNCGWISLNHIESFYPTEKGTNILFSNKVYIDLDISYYIINNQFLKAIKLDAKIRKNRA